MVWRTLADRTEIQGKVDKHTDSVPRASPGSDTRNRVPSGYARRVVTRWEPCPRPTRSTHRENTLPTVSSLLPAMASWDRKPLAVTGSGSGGKQAKGEQAAGRAEDHSPASTSSGGRNQAEANAGLSGCALVLRTGVQTRTIDSRAKRAGVRQSCARVVNDWSRGKIECGACFLLSNFTKLPPLWQVRQGAGKYNVGLAGMRHILQSGAGSQSDI